WSSRSKRALRRNSLPRRSAGPQIFRPARWTRSAPQCARPGHQGTIILAGTTRAPAARTRWSGAARAAARLPSAAGAAVLGRDVGEGLFHVLAAAGPGDLLAAVTDGRAAHQGPPRSVRSTPNNTRGGITACLAGLRGDGRPLRGVGGGCAPSGR